MKVTVTDRAVEIAVEDRVYPYLGSKDGKKGEHLTVLFRCENEGIVIKSHLSDFEVWDDIFVNCESDYTPLVNKTITIEV